MARYSQSILYSSGKGSSRRGRRISRSTHLFSLILLLLIFAGLGYGAFKLFYSSKKDSGETESSSDVFTSSTENNHLDEPANGAGSTNVITPISPEQTIYEEAVAKFRAGNYSAARDRIAPLCENMSQDHVFQEQCRILLNRCSSEILRTTGYTGISAEYVVKSGDSLSKIAHKYGIDVNSIRELNGMAENESAIRIGQVLKIHSGNWSVTVQKKSSRILVYDAGKLFQCFPVCVGSLADAKIRGKFTITGRVRNPVWQENQKRYFSGSPNNIYGRRLLKLQSEKGTDIVSYIHGGMSSKPDASKKGAAVKCFVALSDDDIEELFTILPLGTPVLFVD